MRYDDDGAPAAAQYRLRIANRSGREWTSEPIATAGTIAFGLEPPILEAGGVRLRWALPQVARRAHLTIVDVRGRRVRDLADGAAGAGTHGCTWDRRDAGGALVARGLYWATLVADGRRAAQRVLLVGR